MRNYVMVAIKDPGPKLSEYDISALEKRIGATLPEGYRRFLLEFNGGIPTPYMQVVDVEGLEGGSTDVQVFYGIDDASPSGSIEWHLNTLVERLPEGLVPIAGDSGGSDFCLSVREHDRGAVVFCDLQSVAFDYEHDPEFYPVAPDFDTFLNKMYQFPE
jgi:hypothetical protein